MAQSTQSVYSKKQNKGKEPHFIGASVVNAVNFDRALQKTVELGNGKLDVAVADRIVRILLRNGIIRTPNNEERVDSVNSQAGALMLWYLSDGKHGYRLIHMIADDIILAYCENERADREIVEYIVSEMAMHPREDRRISWQSHQKRFFPEIDAVRDSVNALKGAAKTGVVVSAIEEMSADELAEILKAVQKVKK